MNYRRFFTLLCWPQSITLTARIAHFTFLMASNCGESSASPSGRVVPVFDPLWFKRGADDRDMVDSSLFGCRKWFLSILISQDTLEILATYPLTEILLHVAVRCGTLIHELRNYGWWFGTDRISSAVDLYFGGGGHCRGVPYRLGGAAKRVVPEGAMRGRGARNKLVKVVPTC